MSSLRNEWACLGAPPAFAERLLRDDGEAIEMALHGIFERRFYANHGPLSHALDQGLASCWQQPHAISVVNLQSAAMLLFHALELRGEVLVQPGCRVGLPQALEWLGLRARHPAFDAAGLETASEPWLRALRQDTSAVLLNPARIDAQALNKLGAALRARQVRLLLDAGDCLLRLDADALLLELDETGWVDAGGCAAIACADPRLADRLRTMRSFHPSHTFADVPLRSNTKISEAQAALGLASLGRLEARRQQAERSRRLWRSMRANFPTLDLLPDRDGPTLELAHTPCAGGLSSAELVVLLRSEGLWARHRATASAGSTAQVLLRLAPSQLADREDLERLAALVSAADRAAATLRPALAAVGGAA